MICSKDPMDFIPIVILILRRFILTKSITKEWIDCLMKKSLRNAWKIEECIIKR